MQLLTKSNCRLLVWLSDLTKLSHDAWQSVLLTIYRWKDRYCLDGIQSFSSSIYKTFPVLHAIPAAYEATYWCWDFISWGWWRHGTWFGHRVSHSLKAKKLSGRKNMLGNINQKCYLLVQRFFLRTLQTRKERWSGSNGRHDEKRDYELIF